VINLSSGGCDVCPDTTHTLNGTIWLGVQYCGGGAQPNGWCNPYTGSQDGCNTFCSTNAKKHIWLNNKWTCMFVAHGIQTDGSCTLSGQIDPCVN